jgi:tetratricopeptide (TPR) repeat protein
VVALWWSGGGRGEIESLALSSPGGLAPLRHEKEAIDVPRTTIVMQPRTTTGTIDEPTSEPSAARHAPPRSAAELFSEANEARRAGDLPRATRLYDELVRLHRGSREEVLARATRGRMLLDQGKHAKQALALFDSYLKSSPEGTLAEEALAGRARALGQLGRDSEEAKAWRTLLERHPDTLHRALARERLASLGESLP